MKNILKTIIALFIVFVSIGALGSQNVKAEEPTMGVMDITDQGFLHKAGDIMYTKSTLCKGGNTDDCKGIVGHVAIVYNSTTIVHISGPGAKPTTISVANWYKRYPATKVVRPNSAADGEKAAKWAYDFYIKGDGKNHDYSIGKAGKKDNKRNPYTYCSQIVWQGYKFGANKSLKAGDPAMPKDFAEQASYNNMKVVRTVGW